MSLVGDVFSDPTVWYSNGVRDEGIWCVLKFRGHGKQWTVYCVGHNQQMEDLCRMSETGGS